MLSHNNKIIETLKRMISNLRKKGIMLVNITVFFFRVVRDMGSWKCGRVRVGWGGTESGEVRLKV